MSSIVIAGDTSGSVTLQAPAVAGSTVLNLPATSGTIQASGAGYTTNGVAYATSSTGLATGSALTFDGTTLLQNASGASAQANFRVQTNTAGAVANGYFNINGTDYFRIYTTSSETGLRNLQNTPMYFSVNNTEGMRLTSTGLGIGTSSISGKLSLNETDLPFMTLKRADTIKTYFGVGNGSSLSGSAAAGDTILRAEQKLVMRAGGDTGGAVIDASGNLGLGVTPSAWSGGPANEIRGLSLWANATNGGYSVQNAYYNGSNWIYKTTSQASYYLQGTGIHSWHTAASGTAGNAITFTQAMTLDASGNLGVGTTSPSQRIHASAADPRALLASTGTGHSAWQCQNTSGSSYFGRDNAGGSFFGTSNATVVYSSSADPIIFYTNATERARIDSSGNLLVGTTSSFSARLGVKDSTSNGTTSPIVCKNSSDTTLFYVSSNGYFVTGTGGNSPYNLTTASASNVTIESDGVLKRSTSSLKYKTDVKDATHGLAEVLQLRPVTYKGKNDGNKVFGGLIAEEIHEVGLTEFVQYAEDGTPDALAYGNMVSLCVKAIQEQQALITQLTERITALEAK